MTARTAKQPTMILVVEAGHYRGCVLNRGVQGHESFNAADKSLGVFETPTDARDAILRSFAA